MMSDILITHIHKLVQVREQTQGVVSGAAMRVLPELENAYLLISQGVITDFGLMDNLPSDTKAATTLNASGRLVLPSFVDSHTHLVYAGSREAEFVDRINGLSYEEIAARGGGILNSAKRLEQTSEEELI